MQKADTHIEPQTAISSIKLALQHLEKAEWYPQLAALTSNFTGLEDLFSFSDELLNVLWALVDAKKADPRLPIDKMLAIRLSKMDAWETRAMNRLRDGTHTFWNPLETSFIEFQDETTTVTNTSCPYPSHDIIKRWSTDRFQ